MWQPTKKPKHYWLRRLRGLAIAAFILGYALLVHHVNATHQASMLGAMLALLPVAAVGVTLLRSQRSRYLGAVVLGVMALTAWQQWPQIERHTAIIFWLQDVGLMLFLLLTFGRTLRAGEKPLCVHFAEMLHGPLPTVHAMYARKVTQAWVLFFACMAAISSLLFFMAPLATWSIFVNFLTLPLIGLMFVVEFMVRRRVLTDLPAGSPLDALRAYLDNSARAH